jgi:hypothetical protein
MARKALRDRLRKRGLLADNKRRREPVAPQDARPICCQESGKATCAQHQQARQFRYDTAKEAASQGRDASIVAELFQVFNQGFSIRQN